MIAPQAGTRPSLSPRPLRSRVKRYHVCRRPLTCYSILCDISDLRRFHLGRLSWSAAHGTARD